MRGCEVDVIYPITIIPISCGREVLLAILLGGLVPRPPSQSVMGMMLMGQSVVTREVPRGRLLSETRGSASAKWGGIPCRR